MFWTDLRKTIRISSVIVVSPFRSLKSGPSCGELSAAVPREDCIISCCRLTSSIYNMPVEAQYSPTTYCGFCCAPPAGQCWRFYSSLGSRLKGVTSKPLHKEVLWVTFSRDFISFLFFLFQIPGWRFCASRCEYHLLYYLCKQSKSNGIHLLCYIIYHIISFSLLQHCHQGEFACILSF